MEEYSDKRFIAFAEISLLSNKLQTVMNMGMKEITPRQWLIMIMIGTFETPPTLKELSNRCGIVHQSAKQLLDRLAEKGYVCLLQDEKDKRAIRVQLTERAKNWSMEYGKRNAEFVYGLFEDISEEEVDIYCNLQKRLLKKLQEIENEKMEPGH